MDLSSTRVVPAPMAVVWAALNDPAVLKDCLPGCESIERNADDTWQVAMAVRIGPVSARFNGRMAMSGITPPTGYTLTFEGQGGAAGFAKGDARVTLAPAPDDQTTLTYVAKAQIGGKLAQIGSRLIDGAAAKMTDDFFSRFVERVKAGAPGTAGAVTAAPAPAAKPMMAWSTHWIRYAAIAVIIIILIILYARGFR